MTAAAPAPDTRPVIPAWVTVVDVLCLVLLAMTVRSVFDDSYRIAVTAEWRLSLRSWPRIALWLALLLGVRHWVWRVVPWHRRIAAWMSALWHWTPVRAASGPFLVSRIMVLVVGYIAIHTFGFDPPRPWRALPNDVLDLFARFDAGWYFGIASRSYEPHFNPDRMNAIAFFPGLPLFMRATRILLDVNLWIAGIIVVSGSFLLALAYLYRLARLDLPDDQARVALLLLAFYPFAVCYSAVLTESLFLLSACATIFYFRRGSLVKAALCGLVVGLLRPNGFLLALPLGLLALLPFARARGWLPRGPDSPSRTWTSLAMQLAVGAMPVVGMLLYAAYVNALLGNPFAFVEAQRAWGRATLAGLDVLEARQALIESQGISVYTRGYIVEIFEATAAFAALAAVWPIARRFGLAYAVFVATAVLPPLISMGSVSLGRYTAPLFPIFLWLASAVPAAHRPYWVAAFAAGQALVAALFYTWRAPY